MKTRSKTNKLFGIATVLYLCPLAMAGAADCDPDVQSDAGAQFAYRDRGDRCEGVHRQNVTGRINLRIVGYHTNSVQISHHETFWRVNMRARLNGTASDLSLKVVSLRHTDYFQMDTNELEENGQFVWETDVLMNLPYPPRPRDLAAVACISSCSGPSQEKRQLVPVTFGDHDAMPERELAMILVMADVELKSLEATVTPYGSDIPVFKDKPVGGPFLPANRAQRLLLEGIDNRRVTLKLVGETQSGRRAIYQASLWPISEAE